MTMAKKVIEGLSDELSGKVFEYSQLFDEIQGRVGSDEATTRIITEIAKDLRVKAMQEERRARSQRVAGEATDAQIGYLRDLGMEAPAKLSRVEASKLIDEAKKAEAV